MHLLARLRLELARRPWIYWLVVAALAALVALGVSRAMGRVDEARGSWGEQRVVWVAGEEVDVGQPIVATREPVPRAVVPSHAVIAILPGAVARQHIATGEIVTSYDVTAAGPAALVPDNWMAIAVPAASGHFSVGDHVTVFAAERSLGEGVVIDRTDADVMVALPPTAAGDLAASVLAGTAVLALSP